MSEPEYQTEWDNEVRNAQADEAYEQWVAEQNYELDVHSQEPDQEPSLMAEEESDEDDPLYLSALYADEMENPL